MCRIKTTKQQMELTCNDIDLVHSAPYHKQSTAREFAARGLQEMVQDEEIEPASTNGPVQSSSGLEKVNY